MLPSKGLITQGASNLYRADIRGRGPTTASCELEIDAPVLYASEMAVCIKVKREHYYLTRKKSASRRGSTRVAQVRIHLEFHLSSCPHASDKLKSTERISSLFTGWYGPFPSTREAKLAWGRACLAGKKTSSTEVTDHDCMSGKKTAGAPFGIKAAVVKKWRSRAPNVDALNIATSGGLYGRNRRK